MAGDRTNLERERLRQSAPGGAASRPLPNVLLHSSDGTKAKIYNNESKKEKALGCTPTCHPPQQWIVLASN
ncbi:unnamed protein product [Ceratitis capitata]|uniref:(Mediterranean fruit fly) hypothetical protein n=1 Tax=Ceratitis capitata TaxID=7213 RepID=A0A811VDW5_CERCA|nr:unnamed protein product [Ceratitis capitata]